MVTALAAVTSASGSSFGDSGVSGMQFLVWFAPPDYQRFAGAPKELGGKLPVKRGFRQQPETRAKLVNIFATSKSQMLSFTLVFLLRCSDIVRGLWDCIGVLAAKSLRMIP
jgi:hypothetical protein